MAFVSGGFSCNIMLPILSGIVLGFGFFTGKNYSEIHEKRVRSAHRVLEIRPLISSQKVKLKVDKQTVDS